jgi:hypothetical protein
MLVSGMGKTRKIVLGSLITVFLLLAGGAAWLYVDLDRAFRPKPPDSALPFLLRDLYGNVDEARQRFRQRVHHAFPSGTDAASISAALRRDGFPISAWRLEWASFEQSSFPCHRFWTISWHENPNGKAEDIKGDYSLSCL